ncbi:uncharacterized protein LOC126409746 [Nymphaea colorata]|uniref:uncharacterized protein LOC126409746 n=1 Tax=Nymphaea colorata TaxID=210225 RepID=UPI00214F34B5|nr:uncharacterized protein LOC126409746 [Nymphaea colorata]
MIRLLVPWRETHQFDAGQLCVQVLEKENLYFLLFSFSSIFSHIYSDNIFTFHLLLNLWWERFGPDCPELRKLAIRILSQTCSATRCERNWSVFQHIHSKKRNRLEHKRLNDLVYVRYNMKLRQRQLETTSTRKHHNQYDPIFIDHFDILDSWVEEEPSAILDEDDLDFLNVEGAAEIIDEGEAEGEQWNVGDIPFATEGIEEAINEENEDDDEE